MENFDKVRYAGLAVEWTRDHVNSISPDMNVLVGVSGGKDSSVCAAILKKALGPERVTGVLMPNGVQTDISDSRLLVSALGLKHFEINIQDAFIGLTDEIKEKLAVRELTQGYLTNTPARLRMATLFGLSSQLNALVINTCNRSEDVVGYSTLFGDNAGTFSPIARLTTEEVVAIGTELGLPDSLTHKTPTDGMSLNADGTLMGDEIKLGVSYKEINEIIRTGHKTEHFEKVLSLYKKSRFKLDIVRMPSFDPDLPDYFLENFGL